MSAPVPALFDGLAAAPAHIIHIGAGQARDLDAYMASGAAQITLIEADPDIAAALEARVASESRVRVICAAVSATPGARPFHRASLPELNAFHAPDTAQALFPGLRLLSSESVAPVAPEDLVAGLETAGDGPEILVIEAPGEALGIVQALAASNLLQRFERLRLQEARPSLYSGVAPVEQVQAVLTEAGFVVGADPAGDDPDMPVLIARMDREKKLRHQIARLTAERDHAHARIDSLRQERNAAQSRVETLEAEKTAAQSRIAELETAYDPAAEDALRSQLADMTRTCETLREALESKTRALADSERMTQYRLAQGREEVLRLEGQIRLIRELLLNGTAP